MKLIAYRYKTKHCRIDVDVLLQEHTTEFNVFVTEKRKYISTFWETTFDGDEYDYVGNIPTKSARRWLKRVIKDINSYRA
jgi:hypothetical protein